MKRAFAVAGLLLLAGSLYAGQRAQSLYKTHKISIADVMVSCADGSKPRARTLDNAPVVLVSCPIAVEHAPEQ